MVAERPGDGFVFGMDFELFVDVLHVERDGVDGRPDLFGRRLVVVTFDQQFQQSQLVRRKLIIDIIGRMELLE